MVVSFTLTSANNIIGIGVPLYYTYKEINTPKKPIYWLSYWCLYTILMMLENFFESNEYSICKLFLTLLLLSGDPEMIAELLISPVFSRIEKDIDQHSDMVQEKVFDSIKQASSTGYQFVINSEVFQSIQSYVLSSTSIFSNMEPYIKEIKKSYNASATKKTPQKKNNNKKKAIQLKAIKPKDLDTTIAEKPATMPTPQITPQTLTKVHTPKTPQVVNRKVSPTTLAEKKRE
mmetsp:Transcript_1248/g.1887  ORF Transcript_1248/g.1887 Transcript_1248/m.1887 type:complete len:232 (+) Transcript_1248:1404-2099(+)